MKPPTQCALWQSPELSDDHDFFEILENFADEEHFSRDLRRCKECGQLYVHDFYEEVSFSGGEDYQYATYVPVESREEIGLLKDLTVREVLGVYPRLCKYLSAGTMRWEERDGG